MGKVCLVGCTNLRIDEASRQAKLGETLIAEGDQLCLDGDSGAIYADSPTVIVERPDSLISKVKEWREKALIKQ